MYFWESSILSHDSKKEKDSDKTYVAYKIVIQDSAQSWTTEKRYNDFLALHARLKERFSESQLPAIPPKKGLFSKTNSDPKFIKERAIALEKYVKLLLKNDAPTCQCGEVIDFLDPDKKSSLNNSLPVPLPPRNSISLLPPSPPRLYILNPESIFLPDGEECFLPQFFDHIAESLKYLVLIDNKISTAANTQIKMNIYESEKERIGSTITTLTEQQKVTNQIIQALTSAHQPSAPPLPANNNYNNFNDYSNIYNNTYTNPNPNPAYPNNNNNIRPVYPNHNFPPQGYAPPPTYSPHFQNNFQQRPPPPPAYYGPPPSQFPPPGYHVIANGRPGPPPAPLRGSGGVPNVEGNTILVSYLETCLRHIQEAIIWESGLEGCILVDCANTTSWCEVQERLKWFEAECEKLIVGSLGVSLGKDAKKDLKKSINSLRDQATRFLEELTANPKHKCGLNPASEAEHIYDCKEKLKKTVEFITENKKRLSDSSAEETVAKYETKMFQILEAIANLENATYNSVDERKEYKDKSAAIKKKISSIMRKVSDFRVDLQAEITKIQNHSGDRSNLPDESSLHALNNRLEDLQANLADLSHDFSKALEIAQKRNTLGDMLKDRHFEDIKKAHVQQEDDMFEL